MEAFTHSLTILNWFENYIEKDIPAENLWDDAEGLEQHWKLVKIRQGFAEAPGEGDAEDFDAMVPNDLAAAFKQLKE
jgi:hypothetical protein